MNATKIAKGRSLWHGPKDTILGFGWPWPSYSPPWSHHCVRKNTFCHGNQSTKTPPLTFSWSPWLEPSSDTKHFVFQTNGQTWVFRLHMLTYFPVLPIPLAARVSTPWFISTLNNPHHKTKWNWQKYYCKLHIICRERRCKPTQSPLHISNSNEICQRYIPGSGDLCQRNPKTLGFT